MEFNNSLVLHVTSVIAADFSGTVVSVLDSDTLVFVVTLLSIMLWGQRRR